MGDVDRLVSAEPQRETTAAELLPLVYEELRREDGARTFRPPPSNGGLTPAPGGGDEECDERLSAARSMGITCTLSKWP